MASDEALDVLKSSLASSGTRSLTKLGFNALSALEHGKFPCLSWRMSPWQSWLRCQPYSGLNPRYTVAKLLLHLHSYLRETNVNLIDVSAIGPESTANECNTALRRQIDLLCGYDTKVKPREPVTREPDLQDVILDANNRFSILLSKYAAAEDPGFTIPDEEVRYGTKDSRPTLEETRYKTQAETNVVRVKMGYPPKGVARTDTEEYKRIEEKSKMPDALRNLHFRVLKPLFRWRLEYFIPYREGEIAREELTTVPLTLLGVYEHWFEAHFGVYLDHPPSLGAGLDGVPRVWDKFPVKETGEELGLSLSPDNE